MSRTEVAGKRTYAPKRDCIRAKLLTFFAENPTGMLSRQEVCERFGCTLAGLEYAITVLRREGQIKSLYGPNRTSYYLKGDSPIVKLPKPPRVRKEAKPIRDWPSSTYVAPRPIPTSIFDLARTL